MWTRNLSRAGNGEARFPLADIRTDPYSPAPHHNRGGFPLRKTLGLLLAAATLVGVTGVATAGDGGPPPRAQKILGMVFSTHASQYASRPRGSGNLVYHGGAVQHGTTRNRSTGGPPATRLPSTTKRRTTQF